jgi:hypothetical protein
MLNLFFLNIFIKYLKKRKFQQALQFTKKNKIKKKERFLFF